MTFLIYHLLAVIDTAVYFLASVMFRVIVDIAQSNFFTEGQIADFASRVYIVVGVLMLFKLVIAAVQYMINPDTFDDKEKGMGGILKKTVISVSLIAITPVIFNFLITMQESIISSLPSLILGSEAPKGDDYDHIGSELSFTVLSSFIDTTDAGKKQGASVGIKSGTIHNLDSFNLHITDGCPNFFTEILGGKSMSDCHYNYMIIVSTIAGGFLCYTLLTMILDVSIRLIKFGIIQLLAPIPISSYIFSKDKLNKFVKTATTVYLDLFIRLGIVYFIIFFIQKVVENGTFRFLGPGVADTGNFFRNAIVNIAVIFGLLMFAKSAPKFITELLGLPDVGSGDFADMFKPAWQRAGGAAGALINPARNAVSNYREAWKNNGDMVDPNKSKLRNNLRRAANAGRHGIGGLGKGALDAVQGVMAGDDWSKMNQRHNASVKESIKHSAAGFMKRTSRDEARNKTEAIVNRRKELEDYFNSQGIDINNAIRNSAIGASSAYTTHMSDLQRRINSIQQNLIDGKDSSGMTLDAAGIERKRNELSSLNEEYNRLSTTDGKNAWIANKIDELAAEKLAAKTYSDNSVRLINVGREISRINAELSSKKDASGRPLTTDEIEERRAKLIELQSENDSLVAADTADGRKKILEDKKKTVSEYRDKERDLDEIRTKHYKRNSDGSYVLDKNGNEVIIEEKPDISTRTIISGKIDQFFGGEGFTGQGYTDVADILSKNREGLWQKEAMGKLKQSPSILSENGVEHQFVLNKVTLPYNLKIEKLKYSEILDLVTKVDSGTLEKKDRDRIEAIGFKSTADLKAAFADVEKQAASDYVRMANKGDINNPTIVEGIKRMTAIIASANIPVDEKNKLLSALKDNPGKFLKDASTIQELLRTKGSRISAYNSGKKDA